MKIFQALLNCTPKRENHLGHLRAVAVEHFSVLHEPNQTFIDEF